MEMFNVWLMPENKFKSSESKWIEQDVIEAKSRKAVVGKIDKAGERKGAMAIISSAKNGCWKVRKV